VLPRRLRGVHRAPPLSLRHRKVIRTTNLLERLFLEERRRTKIIPHAFGERPILKLMHAAVIRAADRWRGITVGEFEQRQLHAIRDDQPRARRAHRASRGSRVVPPARNCVSASGSRVRPDGAQVTCPHPQEQDGVAPRDGADSGGKCDVNADLAIHRVRGSAIRRYERQPAPPAVGRRSNRQRVLLLPSVLLR